MQKMLKLLKIKWDYHVQQLIVKRYNAIANENRKERYEDAVFILFLDFLEYLFYFLFSVFAFISFSLLIKKEILVHF